MLYLVLYLLAAAVTAVVVAGGGVYLMRHQLDLAREGDPLAVAGWIRSGLSLALVLYLVVRYGWATDGMESGFNLLVAKALAGAAVAAATVLGAGLILALAARPGRRGPALRRFAVGAEGYPGPVPYTLIALVVSAATFGFVRYSVATAQRADDVNLLVGIVLKLTLVLGVVLALLALAAVFTAAAGDMFGAGVAHPFLAPLAAPALLYGLSSHGDVLVRWISGDTAADLAAVPGPVQDKLQLGTWILTLALSAFEILRAHRAGARIRGGPAPA